MQRARGLGPPLRVSDHLGRASEDPWLTGQLATAADVVPGTHRWSAGSSLVCDIAELAISSWASRPILAVSAPGPVSAAGRVSAAVEGWAVAQVRPVGPGALWAWFTQASVTGERAYDEEVVLTVDGGASWMDRTPPGLATATAHRAVAQVTALSAGDAWVAYGDVVRGSALSLVATTDEGRQWESLGRLPSPYARCSSSPPAWVGAQSLWLP